MNGNEIRTRFLEYFADKGHTIVRITSYNVCYTKLLRIQHLVEDIRVPGVVKR